MKIECPSCQTSLKMDDAKIPERGVKAKCPKCGALIHVKRPVPEETAPDFFLEVDQQYSDPPPHMPPPMPEVPAGPPPYTPGASRESFQKVPDRMIISILITLFLCLPVGVVAIIFSARARSQKAAGNYEQARSSAKVAGILCLVGGLGIIPVIGIMAAIAIPQFVVMKEKGMDAASRAALSNLRIAEEAYYLDHNTYTSRLGDLGEIFEPEANINIEIMAADDDSWSAWARHESSDNRFVYSSSEGGLRGPE